jgi:hypothetical protein
VDVGVDATRNDEQATGVELARSAHYAAELRYPSVPQSDIGDLTAARTGNRPTTDDKVELSSAHQGILTRPDPGTSASDIVRG